MPTPYEGYLTPEEKANGSGKDNNYDSWKRQIKDYKGIIVDGDNTYDYKRFYDENPDIAWGMLRGNTNAHFIDRYKTPYHPTYSDESLYSSPPFIQGGHWKELLYPTASGQKWNYQLSPSQVASNWDIARTLDYATDAEDEGFYITDSQGRYPIFDGTIQGGVLPSVNVSNHEDGGFLTTHKLWNELSIKEKADMMKVAIRNGITNLADIKAKYNEFAEGGYMTSEEDNDVNMYDGISQRSQQMQQRYIYDILPRLYAMDGVNVVLSSGLRPNAVVYQNGKPTGRKSRHGSGQAADIVPTNGSTFADIFRVLHDPNSNVSRWMQANNAGYIDETSATGTTKYWHDHNRDHSHVHHQIGGTPASQYASMLGRGYLPLGAASTGNYREIAKQHIRQNEGWRATPYADGPNSWRSVGYGFNDSGFYAKYPRGISNYYAQRGGITKAEAERELDWYLDNMEASLRKTYGRRWDSFSDNQKAAIMDTAYQRPASVDAKSAFYAAVMSGNPNAGNLLGVSGYKERNADRRNLFNSTTVQAINPQNYGHPQMAYSPFEGWEPLHKELLEGSYNPERDNIIMNQAQEIAQLQAAYDRQQKQQLEAAQQEALRQEKELQRNRTNLALQMVGMMGGEDGFSFDMLRPLTYGNMGAYGGHKYDGKKEPTQLMKKRGDYETVPTGITDKITLKGGDWSDAYLSDGTKLTAEDKGDYWAYSNGDSIWRVPKTKDTPLRDLSSVVISEKEDYDPLTDALSGGMSGLIYPEYYDLKVNPFGQKLRDRMYKTVTPTGYTLDNAMNFIKGNPRKYLDLNTEALYGKYLNQDSVYGYANEFPTYSYDPSDGTYLMYSKPGRLVGFESFDNNNDDDVKESSLRKVAVSDLVKPSSVESGAYELVYPWASEFPTGSKKFGHFHNVPFGTFSFNAGNDDKGHYVEYKDTWDLNPWKGVSKKDDSFFRKTSNFGLSTRENIVPWGIPFNIHGKFYQGLSKDQVTDIDGNPVYWGDMPIYKANVRPDLDVIVEMLNKGVIKQKSPL